MSVTTTSSSAPPRERIALLVARDSPIERAIATALRGAGVQVLRARTLEGAMSLASTFTIDATIAVITSPSDLLAELARHGRGLTCAIVPAQHREDATMRGFDVVVPLEGDIASTATRVRDALAPVGSQPSRA